MAMRQVLKKLLRNVKPAMYTSSILFAHCVSPDKPSENAKLKLELLDVKKLTYEHMIRQSALDATNSATQALTVTYMAITHLSTEYRTLLKELISLHEETLNYNVSDVHWDAIVETRNQMQLKKEGIMNLTGYMDYVHKMAEAASMLSYLSGMDNISNTLQQRIDDALNKIKVEIESNAELEREYLRIQEQCIKDNKKTEKE
ncbi:hypothetical protein DMN91_012573 [Ooceraea biroi]|uniref:Direct IAP-binding protein with low pI n=1 Tax=Ooceraea biroi TaxID=2015173 RepID=A0A026VV96_OOCBI|nr:uncharacterized protein LOC105286272 [Ooceraea biroi]EZA47657.1 hypothetical protein X777_15405 [Ooceraea biroi]RLU15579.1 hypothetical protein DMN91_012573 [Ooceraea biroi]